MRMTRSKVEVGTRCGSEGVRTALMGQHRSFFPAEDIANKINFCANGNSIIQSKFGEPNVPLNTANIVCIPITLNIPIRTKKLRI